MKANYLKPFFFILLLLAADLVLYAQDLKKDTIKMEDLTIYPARKGQHINWINVNLDEAVKKARLEKKNILVYFTAKWCGPCRKMEQGVLSANRIISTVNDKYLAIKIDVDAWGAKKWIARFPNRGMPEFYIINAKGQSLRRSLGAIPLNEFLDFLNFEETSSSIKMSDTARVAWRPEIWKRKIDLGIGAGASSLNNSADAGIFGYEINLGYSFEKERLSFNPGLMFTSVGAAVSRLNYISLPLQAAFNFYKGSVFGLPGGYKLLAAPYYGRLLNDPGVTANKNDVGVDYGLGIYMGSATTASITFSIKARQGFTDVLLQPGKQTNQFIRASVTLAVGNN